MIDIPPHLVEILVFTLTRIALVALRLTPLTLVLPFLGGRLLPAAARVPILFVLAIGFALENGGRTPVHHLFALASLVIVFKVPGALGGAEKTAHKLESAFATGLHGLQHAVTRAA